MSEKVNNITVSHHLSNFSTLFGGHGSYLMWLQLLIISPGSFFEKDACNLITTRNFCVIIKNI